MMLGNVANLKKMFCFAFVSISVYWVWLTSERDVLSLFHVSLLS